MKKYALPFLAIVVLIVLGTGFYVWKFVVNKPRDRDANEKSASSVLIADSLASTYQRDEKAADTKYLNKVLEVSGVIGEIEKNQENGRTVALQTSDPMCSILCAQKDTLPFLKAGQQVTIKGYCSGKNIAGISLTDCSIKK